MAGMVRDLKPDLARMKAAAGSGYSTATDLADWLVQQLEMPFRQAHHAHGPHRGSWQPSAVLTLEDLPLDILQSVEPRITQAVFSVLGVDEFGEEPNELWWYGALLTYDGKPKPG